MHVLIVDGLNLIRRVHAAVAAPPTEKLDVERLAEACRSSLAKVLKRRQPSHALCVMDSSIPSWRHELYPDYKANRDPMPDPLRDALGDILQTFETLSVRAIQKDGFEADDVIATIASRIANARGQVTIASTDKSFCQLLGEHIDVYDHFSDRHLDNAYVLQRFGVPPGSLNTLFALTGNPSVNVPGVRSIGPRIAAELIREFGDLEAILEAAAGMKDRVGSKLREEQESARLAMRLLSLRTDLELGLNVRDFRCR